MGLGTQKRTWQIQLHPAAKVSLGTQKGCGGFLGRMAAVTTPNWGHFCRQAVRLSEITCRFVIRALQTSGYKWQKCSLLCLHPHKYTRAAAASSTLSVLHWVLFSIPIDPHKAYLPLGAALTSGGGAVQHRGWLESFIWGLPSLLWASDFWICFAREHVCAEFLAEAREVRGFPQHPELRDQYWPQEQCQDGDLHHCFHSKGEKKLPSEEEGWTLISRSSHQDVHKPTSCWARWTRQRGIQQPASHRRSSSSAFKMYEAGKS